MTINERALLTVQRERYMLCKELSELEKKYHEILLDEEHKSRYIDSDSSELAKMQHVVISLQASISELE